MTWVEECCSWVGDCIVAMLANTLLLLHGVCSAALRVPTLTRILMCRPQTPRYSIGYFVWPKDDYVIQGPKEVYPAITMAEFMKVRNSGPLHLTSSCKLTTACNDMAMVSAECRDDACVSTWICAPGDLHLCSTWYYGLLWPCQRRLSGCCWIESTWKCAL